MKLVQVESLKPQVSSLSTNGLIVMRNFKKLKTWEKGMLLVDKVYRASIYFPEEEKFGMRSQFTRSGVSIPANIAEGCAKKSEKDYLRYMEISLGSSYELETHLLIIQKRNWFPPEILSELLGLTIEVQRMLTKFIERTA
jgi:four helix bundle protein